MPPIAGNPRLGVEGRQRRDSEATSSELPRSGRRTVQGGAAPAPRPHPRGVSSVGGLRCCHVTSTKRLAFSGKQRLGWDPGPREPQG
ncbi:Jun dimerization protein 1, isoform CRA_b [Rattus norvegicus]|uniref:Jun dimerization protein 1, isoform CRA_b n=1 Tax=Rattus norvegicus TaxID=10116 RepID=A6JGY6_RAT|nr:Jun dimerization protein 1, isoform CRA_b [Rattus norvegicus]